MELACVLLLLMLGTSAAAPQDLGGKMFTFPQETETDHVTLKVNQSELGALSVCMRVFSDLLRPHCLFQLSINSSYDSGNNFCFSNDPRHSIYRFTYDYTETFFNHKNNYVINAWQAVCATWDAATGLVQLFIDGKHSSRRFLSESHMMGPFSVTLGQCNAGPRTFDTDIVFVGMLTELHVWNYTLLPIQIQKFGRYSGFLRGNVVNWRSLEFDIHGRILLESI